MKKYILPSLKMTLVLLIICSVIYPLLVAAIGHFSPGKGKGTTETVNGKVVGYSEIGQKFDQDKYFWSRPSAVAFNAAGSAGSNKGPTNPDYLKDVQSKIDTFLIRNPGIRKEEVPVELVTYSGSGLDPDISPRGALVQVVRIAKVRGIPEEMIKALVDKHTEKSFLGLLGPDKVNVLKLNIDLDMLGAK
jgi:K+-transporting ATPase ATPase C chain